MARFLAVVFCLAALGLTAKERYFCGDKDSTELTNVRYVSGQGTDSDGCGASLSSPCATIGRGLANCSGSGCAVLAAFDEYDLRETLTLRDGGSLYGGSELPERPNPPPMALLPAAAET